VIKQNYVPEFNILVSNPSLIKSLGWSPKIGIQELAEIMMGTKKLQ
jgi:GDP-D-mannose dehydratase